MPLVPSRAYMVAELGPSWKAMVVSRPWFETVRLLPVFCGNHTRKTAQLNAGALCSEVELLACAGHKRGRW